MKLKENGQISVDLIFTIIIAIIVIGTLVSVLSEVNNTQEKILLKKELEQNAINLSTSIIAAQQFQDTNFVIEIKIMPIRFKEKVGYPEFITNNRTITITEKLTEENITASESINIPTWAKIIITTNKVVIKNA